MDHRRTLNPRALILLFTLAVLTCGQAKVYAADCPTCQASFTSSKLVTVGDFSYVVTGDFNGDGKLDLAVSKSNGVVFLAGDGAGNFGAPVVTALASRPLSVAAGDFDGDGKLDLVVTDTTANVVRVLLGDGSGGFAVHQSVAVPALPRSMAAADFDGDGKLDLAVLSHPICTGEGDIRCATNPVTLFSGDGAGNLAPAGSFPAGASLSFDIAAADFNGDGKVDLAALGDPSTTSTVLNPAPVASVWFGDGDFGFGAPTRLGRADHLTAGDFNGDGTTDLAATTPATISIYLADGASGFTQFDNPNYPLPDTSRFASLRTMITADDFNGDGNADVAVNNPFRGDFTVSAWSAYVPLGDGSGGLETPAPAGVGSIATFLAAGDFDSDGRPDLAAVNPAESPTGAGLSVMLNRTDCTQPVVCVRPGVVTLTEGNLGTVNADVTVSLSAPADHTVTVDFATAEYDEFFGYSAQSGIDFKPAAGTLTFDPGVTTQTVSVEVFGDTIFELNETFRVALSNANGAGVAALPFLVKPPFIRILNDDPWPSATSDMHFSVSDMTVVEGDSGTRQAVFTVTRAEPSPFSWDVSYRTADGTATIADYIGVSNSSVHFAPGDTIRTISVRVIGDTTAEGDETFFVDLIPNGGPVVFDRARGTGTIINDDGAPPVGLQYYPLAHPIRLLDTRPGAAACYTPGSPLAADASLTQPAVGACQGVSIPATARAIVGNATVVSPPASGHITLYPSDAPLPLASNLNYVAGQVVPNAFTVGLSGAGSFNIYTPTSTHFIVDVAGYYAPPGEGGLYYHPLPRPVRLLDTRIGESACDAPGATLQADSVRKESARTTCGGVTIPNDAQAIVGNATVDNRLPGASQGWIILYPSGTSQPEVSNLNYVAGQVVPNAFTVGLGADGAFDIYSYASTEFILDVTGYYSASAAPDANGVAGLLFYPLQSPARLLDTRSWATACFTPKAPLSADSTRTQPAQGSCAGSTVPATALAVSGNATVTEPAANGYIILYPSGGARPVVSNLNYLAGQTIPNAFNVSLGAGGAFDIYTPTATEFLIDLTGYFAP